MKIFYIISSILTLYLMYRKFEITNDKKNDTFPVLLLVIPAMILAVLVNYQYSFLEVNN
jgi:ER lumen protein retaining receptor